MSQKESTKSLEQLKDNFENDLKEAARIKGKLSMFGINVTVEEAKNIYLEIRTQSLIIARNLKTRNRMISSIIAENHFKVDNSFINIFGSAIIRFEHPQSGAIEDQYYHNDKNSTIQDILSSKEKMPDYRTISRTYRNIATKHGVLCLVVEDNIKDVKYERELTHIRIALYNKNKLPSTNESSIDYNRDCIFEWKYFEDTKESIHICKSDGVNYTHPRTVISYDKIEGTDDYIYSNYTWSLYCSGIVLRNGNINIYDNPIVKLPDRFDDSYRRLLFKEEEKTPHTSKAYFVSSSSYGDALSVVKDNDDIILRRYQFSFNRWIKSLEKVIKSNTTGQFTSEDINLIINETLSLELNNDIKSEIIRSLYGYINTHKDSNLDEERIFTLKDKSYEQLSSSIKNESITTLSEKIEKGIELLSNMFQIPINELLGIKETKPVKEIR